MPSPVTAPRGALSVWPPLLGLVVLGGLTAIDAAWASDQILIATVLLAPFVTALWGSVRDTVLVGAATAAVTVASGAWNDNFGSGDYVVRLAVVLAGCGFAVAAARTRERLSLDRERFGMLWAIARLSVGPARAEEDILQRVADILVPALADVAVLELLSADGRPGGRVASASREPGVPALAEALRAAGAASAMGDRAGAAVVEPPGAEAVGLRSAVAVPLRARRVVIGTLAMACTDVSGRRFDAADLEFTDVLAGRVGLVLDNSGLATAIELLEAQRTAALERLAEAVVIEDATGA